MSILKAHSARGASSSVCRSSSVSLPFILFRADWSNNKTFKKFYDIPLLLKKGSISSFRSENNFVILMKSQVVDITLHYLYIVVTTLSDDFVISHAFYR